MYIFTYTQVAHQRTAGSKVVGPFHTATRHKVLLCNTATVQTPATLLHPKNHGAEIRFSFTNVSLKQVSSQRQTRSLGINPSA